MKNVKAHKSKLASIMPPSKSQCRSSSALFNLIQPRRQAKGKERKTKRIMIRNPAIKTMTRTIIKQVAITLRAAVISHLTIKLSQI